MADGHMTYVPANTAYRTVEPSVKPILSPLAEATFHTGDAVCRLRIGRTVA
jgi:hypothetical protein